MYANSTNCHYHPSKMAITICERCRRPICLDDKRIYNKRHTKHYGKFTKTYYTQHDYCVLCNASQLRRDASSLGLVIFLPIIFIFFIIIISFGFKSAGGSIIIMGMLLLMALIFSFSYINAQKKAKAAEIDAYNFKMTLQGNPSNYDTPSYYQNRSNTRQSSFDNTYMKHRRNQISKENLFDISCYECGARINIDDKYCQNCGDSTKEELESYYRAQSS